MRKGKSRTKGGRKRSKYNMTAKRVDPLRAGTVVCKWKQTHFTVGYWRQPY